VTGDWLDEDFRHEERNTAVAELYPPGNGGITGVVLPPVFTEEQLLAFLTVRSDLAWELERRYTNDRPKVEQPEVEAAVDTEGENQRQPLDENALGELATLLPNFAALLRRRLPKGSRWHVVDESPVHDKQTDAVRQASAPKTWRDVAWDYVVHRLRTGRFATAVELYHALHNEAGTDGSPFDKGEGHHRGSLWVREVKRTVALKTLQNHWPILLAAARTQ
jgi:hypothetical protein